MPQLRKGGDRIRIVDRTGVTGTGTVVKVVVPRVTVREERF